jgi:hypothetical protein
LITCIVKYEIDPDKLPEFEQYAKMWIPLVERLGGHHHGYFLPSEGANDNAFALFSFPSLADYEAYRLRASEDAGCRAAVEFQQRTKCFVRYERSFFRPILSGS